MKRVTVTPRRYNP